ncbi:cupin domain-containing protein [Aliamphritea hakodatensis]|uniref:cupin domain-containing protein n=1 Tax=Aliamphritea hakodatensis TaxID=2895352 RepID=UPI0022FD62DE|nr:cupin domain-containing protein [Aliamphritea hakodatensis]
MVTISIPVGDYFQHTHDHESTSEILQGVARVKVGTQTFVMNMGELISVPADTPHSFENISQEMLLVSCGHKNS